MQAYQIEDECRIEGHVEWMSYKEYSEFIDELTGHNVEYISVTPVARQYHFIRQGFEEFLTECDTTAAMAMDEGAFVLYDVTREEAFEYTEYHENADSLQVH